MSDDDQWPSAGEVEARSRQHGLFAKVFYLVETTPVGPLRTLAPYVVAHLEHQRKLEQDGVLFAAGPLMTDDGQMHRGEGLFVIRAESLREAHEIVSADPMHVSGARRFRIRPWLINEGSLSLTVRLSAARGTLE